MYAWPPASSPACWAPSLPWSPTTFWRVCGRLPSGRRQRPLPRRKKIKFCFTPLSILNAFLILLSFVMFDCSAFANKSSPYSHHILVWLVGTHLWLLNSSVALTLTSSKSLRAYIQGGNTTAEEFYNLAKTNIFKVTCIKNTYLFPPSTTCLLGLPDSVVDRLR